MVVLAQALLARSIAAAFSVVTGRSIAAACMVLAAILGLSQSVTAAETEKRSWPFSDRTDGRKTTDARRTSDARKTIVFGILWEPIGFFPHRALDSASYYAQTLVYDGLVKYDARMDVVPALAESFSVSADGLVYRFLLRRGARFSDGSEITPDDVLQSVRLASSSYSPYKDDYRNVKTIELVRQKSGSMSQFRHRPDNAGSDTELRLTLDKPCAPLLNRLVELRILPAKLLGTPDRGMAVLSRQPLSSGPFVLKRWESGLELVFERNDFYWGEKAKVDRIVWRVVPEMGLLALAVNRGDIDVAQIDARSYQSLIVRNNNLALDPFCGSRTVYVGFNMERSPFNEPAVRRAIAMSIDRSVLLADFFLGFGFVPATDFSRGRWAYDGEAQPVVYDRNQAAELLQSAGFRLSDGKWRRRTGGRDEIIAFKMQTAKDYVELAECVASQLSKNHIQCEVEVVEFASLRSRYLQKGAYDVVLWSRSSGPDPDCVLVWSSKGAMNFSRFKNPVMDELIESGRVAVTRAQRKRSYSGIQRMLAKELPWVFLAQPQLLVVRKRNIAGVQRANQKETGLPWDNPLFNAAYWDINP